MRLATESADEHATWSVGHGRRSGRAQERELPHGYEARLRLVCQALWTVLAHYALDLGDLVLCSLCYPYDLEPRLNELSGRYKNRQIIGPNSKCIGLDMNRYVTVLICALTSLMTSSATGYSSQLLMWIAICSELSSQGHKWKPTARFPAFKGPSTGTDPCSHWYPGHRAFESPEVNNIANYITTLPNLRAYVDLRSYGQMSQKRPDFLFSLVPS